MTREEMRERVALAISETPRKLMYSREEAWQKLLSEADAAIAIIRGETLEEAARECERIETEEHQKWKKHADMMAQGASDGAGDCAIAIRALKETRDE